ncbi:response regulator [Vibrio cincinnatiensis]|uniref:GGDEF domain-containing response regulator n=1 Tax=Vibrio cincinnatiensis TaxID=675 RepID=UPI001EDEC48D|nr:diguanylate cyclase [Vibrio cincinnatiensis]MCG3735485.1 response regulator [Vibrio cincinnatiensis]MCG3746948.1 response regulator [Vibrio cincinnatiensis]
MNHRILVVDDSIVFRNYLVHRLSALNFEIIVASSYEETQRIMEDNPNFFFAIMDYCLPDAQDGEAIKLLIQHKQKTIVLTDKFDEETRKSFLKMGVLDYILKENHASISYILELAQRLKNNTHHHALVVDDSLVARKQISQLLENHYIKTTLAMDGCEAIEILKSNKDITFIITDNYMPKKDGIAMVRELRKSYSNTVLPILGLSSESEKNITPIFLKSGANDFLHKPFHQEEFYCRVHQLLNIKESNDNLFKLANEDALTGLWNRRYLFGEICKGMGHRNVAMIDIDFFKKVNDRYGHDGGDEVIKMVARLFKKYFSSDIISRLGGEEFFIYSKLSIEDFLSKLETLRLHIATTPVIHQDQVIEITISIGVSSLNGTLDEQIKQADIRLYLSKENGRNRVTYQ